MVSQSNSSKFQDILTGIHRIIDSDQLQPGDRLPSERELSDRLHAGRSSVREALRSLELVGLISTKRGEGTFLEPYRTNQLVQLLATYILRDLKSLQDLWEIRTLLELGAVRLATQRFKEEDLVRLEKVYTEMERLVKRGEHPKREIEAFHELIIHMADNYLLIRIWYPMISYVKAMNVRQVLEHDRTIEKAIPHYHQLLTALQERKEDQAVSALEQVLAVIV